MQPAFLYCLSLLYGICAVMALQCVMPVHLEVTTGAFKSERMTWWNRHWCAAMLSVVRCCVREHVPSYACYIRSYEEAWKF